MSTIAVIGTGYVGLVSGACLADFGNMSLAWTWMPAKIERLKRTEKYPSSSPAWMTW